MSCPQFLGMVVESCTVTCTGMELCHLPHPDLLSFGWGKPENSSWAQETEGSVLCSQARCA